MTDNAYADAIAKHNEAYTVFAAAQSEYRNTVGSVAFSDATDRFLAAKAVYDAATAEFDAAYAVAAQEVR